ncbi:MAG: hypothetical protein S4CHLAM81_04870 [Chlamydiales bacterium]|nr:hypothetical protein [Chlamydiales bacterium]MCH9635276.1 hypothetical protein [Chlamydiales bacterium]
MLESRMKKAFEKCLRCQYLLSSKTILRIQSKLDIFFSTPANQLHLDNFLEKTTSFLEHKAKNPTSQPFASDAIYAASNSHECLFEDQFLRILWAHVGSFEYVPAHTHQWKGLMIVVSTTLFTITNTSTGQVDVQKIPTPIGIYNTREGADSLAYENLCDTPFKALSFEWKD